MDHVTNRDRNRWVEPILYAGPDMVPVPRPTGIGSGNFGTTALWCGGWQANFEESLDGIYVIWTTAKHFLNIRNDISRGYLTFMSCILFLQVDGTILAHAAGSTAWNSGAVTQWLEFKNVRGLSIQGCGAIDGQGSEWWSGGSVAGDAKMVITEENLFGHPVHTC